MRSPAFLTKPLMLSLCALAVSACAGQGGTYQNFPSAADLAVEAKPVPGPDIVTSAQAAGAYDISVEAWGERGWRTVGRLCRWAEGLGMQGLDCPPPPSAPPDP
jgi:hypothetical protein